MARSGPLVVAREKAFYPPKSRGGMQVTLRQGGAATIKSAGRRTASDHRNVLKWILHFS